MAKLSQRRSENVDGNFYVDSTCIDCDTCRWMAPDIFGRVGSMSAVEHQPEEEGDRHRAMQALLSCPTASIGTVEKPRDIKAVQTQFPLPITENIYHCGFHSKKSYGAASYFIQRPEGNVLVDSPQFSKPLVKQLEAMGGIRYLYLTHRDDVADHAKWQAHFNQANPEGMPCERILHADEINSGTQDVEIKIEGSEPVDLAPDLKLITVPGHTEGHTVLLYTNPASNQRILFTGDHLAWSARLDHLVGFNRFCWYSWEHQIESMTQLAEYDFEWVLPGHGRRYQADVETMRSQMQRCLAWMETVR